MTDRTPFSTSSTRNPLQEFKGSNNDTDIRRPAPIGESPLVMSAQTSRHNKETQENIPTQNPISAKGATNLFVRKTSSGTGKTTVASQEKNLQRNKIALKQKASATMNTSNYISKTPQHKQTIPVVSQEDALAAFTKSSIKMEPISSLQPTKESGNTRQTQTQAQVQPQTHNHPQFGSPEWVRALKKTLPTYKFYFDAVDHATAVKLSRTLQKYNASVSMFFSNGVTHIITTRPIPNDMNITRNKPITDKEHVKDVAQSQISSFPTQAQALAPVPGKSTLKATGLLPIAQLKPENTIFAKAKTFNCKIWSLDKLLKLLKPLMTETVTPTENKGLQELLLQEKAHGLATNHKDSSSKGEYYIFKGPFLLIEDTTGCHHTIMAHEYPVPKSENERRPWPGIYVQTTDRTPFAYRERRPQRPKKTTREVTDARKEPHKGVDPDLTHDKDSARDPPPKDTMQRTPSAFASGIVNSVTSRAASTNPTLTKITSQNVLPNTQGRVLEQLGKRILNATKGEAGVAPSPAKNPHFVRPSDVIKPTKTIKPSLSHDLTSTKREPMAAVDTNIINARAQPHKNLPSFSTKVQAPVLSSTNRPVASSRHNPANVAPIPALNLHCLPPDPQLPNVDSQHYTRYPQQLVKAQKTTQITPKMGPPAALTALKDYSKLGYCENCRRYYEDFDQHISTEQHRRYAQDTTKFEQLDELLATVQRKPKGLPNLLEKDITTDDRAEKDQRSSSANVLNTSVATKTSETDNSFDTKTDIYTENDTQSMATEENVNQLLVGSLGKSFLKASAVTTNDDSNQERQRQPSKLQQEKVVAEEAKEAQVKDNKKDLGEQGDEVADFEIEQSAVPKEEEGVDEGMHEVGDGDNVEKELSSELERLDVSENGEEEQDVGHDEGYEDSIKVAMEEQSTEPIAFPSTEISPLSISRHTVSTDNRLIDKPLLSTPTLKRTSVSQIKAASQIETDATQPDERFLEESNLGTVSTDPVTPIRLALSMTSADTDGLEAAPPTLKNIFAMSEEGSGEEMDDAVALLKSPSAGRNAFARTQGLDLGRGKEKTFTSNIPEGSFKRKLELALAEDAEDMDMHYDFYSRSHLSAIPRTEQSITYDDKLQCNLMSQPSHRYRHQQKYQQQSHTPPYIPAWTSPPALPRHQQGHNLALTSASLPSPIQFGALQPTPPSSRYLTQQGQIDTPNGGALQRQQTRYPGTSADLSSFSIHNNPLQLQQYHCTPVSIPTPAPLLQQMSMQQQQGQYFEGNVDEYITDADYDQSLYKGRLTSSTSPTSPLSHRQFDFSGPSMPSRTLNLMDSFNCSQGTAQMSPRRSPSHHASHRSQTYFPVMSHAEQERERCYHYSRGNRLPEPAGQKKMRNSSSLEEAFEEYGEGCMVFIE